MIVGGPPGRGWLRAASPRYKTGGESLRGARTLFRFVLQSETENTLTRGPGAVAHGPWGGEQA